MVHAVTEAVYPGVGHERVPQSVRGQVGKAARELCAIGLPATAPADIRRYIQREETWRTGKITAMTLVSCAADWQRSRQQGSQGIQNATKGPARDRVGCQPGERRQAPDGQVWTVESVNHGAVNFEEYEAPPYVPVAVVLTWAVLA